MQYTKSKKKLLARSRLCVILNKKSSKDKDPLGLFKKIINQGADIVQLRYKDSPKIEVFKLSQRLSEIAKKNKIIFIINDFADIAKIVNADGLHIGQDDLDIKEARRILGKDKIIGATCRNIKQLMAAKRKGADYIAIGPIFPTDTKPKLKPIGIGLLKKMNKRLLSIPVFAIGGINKDNLNMVLANGIKRIAVSSAIAKSGDPSLATKELKLKLEMA